MHFKTLSAFVSVALISITSAQNLRMSGFSDTGGCDGSYFSCIAPVATCCILPTGYGFSVQFDNLPDTVYGRAFANAACTPTTTITTLYGSGTKCFAGRGRVTGSLSWFGSFRQAATPGNSTCEQVSRFTYKDGNGQQREIQVPKAASETVADLYNKKDFEALASYELA